jgi:hypothetical protein
MKLQTLIQKVSVAAAIMFGRERPQAGILIETPPSPQIHLQNDVHFAELRNKVW